MSGADEAYVGRRVFTSSENVRTDDAEVEANEQMMKNARGVKEKVFSVPDGEAVGTSLVTAGMDFPVSHRRAQIRAHVQSSLLSLRATCPAPGHQSIHPCVFDGGGAGGKDGPRCRMASPLLHRCPTFLFINH